MKLIPFLIILYTTRLFGQDASPAEARAEFLNQKYWSNLGKATEGTRGFALFSRNIAPNAEGLYELWVKIIPANAPAFNRKYDLPKNAAFAVQYATVNCGKRQLLMEKTAVYDSANNALDAKSSELVQKATRSRVKPGSIGETVFDYICLKL